jgi:hypothetical protein
LDVKEIFRFGLFYLLLFAQQLGIYILILDACSCIIENLGSFTVLTGISHLVPSNTLRETSIVATGLDHESISCKISSFSYHIHVKIHTNYKTDTFIAMNDIPALLNNTFTFSFMNFQNTTMSHAKLFTTKGYSFHTL